MANDSQQVNKTESTDRSGVFFVYKTINPDKDWVKSTVEKLEKTGQRCFYHERDFLPGLQIIENIVRFLQRSSKVIVVLTPAFLQSQWVEYETQLAKKINIENPEQLQVIPVLLEDCAIPPFLSTTTYLDVQHKTEEQWFAILKESLRFECQKELSFVKSRGIHRNLFCKLKSVQGKQENDLQESWLIDLCFTEDDHVLVTDAKNKKLKKFVSRGANMGATVDVLQFDSRPMFLTLFNDISAYVTFPENEFIRVISAGNSQLAIKDKFTVPLQCGGICKLDEEKFAVCCRSLQSIILMKRNGTQLSEIRPLKGDPFEISELDLEQFCENGFEGLQIQESDFCATKIDCKKISSGGTDDERNIGGLEESDSGLPSQNHSTIPPGIESAVLNEAYDTDEENDNFLTFNEHKGGKKDFRFLKTNRLKAREDKTHFIMPNHISATSAGVGKWMIYVGDYTTNRITVIYMAENGSFRYRPLPPVAEPRGILVHGETVLVAAGSVRIYTDKHLSKASEENLSVEASHPRSLALNKKGDLFALTHKGDGDEFISIYTL
ncbi:uncharacterized protein LOC134250457 [Saccostrea cucullata]|uniref:uncharacterized protein LOC134250457 n=1 Tax=Saccostrea cuccullata TaxID=36930 RepID=UPI002ED1EF8A